jgi:uncharacterized membrane protein (DUF373 family)
MKRLVSSIHNWFEKIIVVIVLLMMMLVVTAAAFDMMVGLWQMFTSYKSVADLVTIAEIDDLFASFLLILIGVELLQTVKMYLHDNVIRVEVVFVVAMIAVVREVIHVDLAHAQAVSVLATGALILALTTGYYLIRRSNRRELSREAKPPQGT